MSFAWPLALLLVLAVPLVLGVYVAALRRRRRQAISYSSVALLRAAIPSRSRWLRHVPVAALLAAIAVLALASARPEITADVPAQKTSIILALDESGPFVVSMPVARCVPPVVERLREVLVTHPGKTEVHLKLRGNERTTLVRLDDKLRVAASSALIGDLKQLLGPACVG